jgi:hypothetical protein
MFKTDDIQPAVIVHCGGATEIVELTPTEKQAKLARAAEHEAKEQQKAAEKTTADNLLRLLAGNPNASVKASELLILLKQLGFDPATLGQTKGD